MSFEDCRDGRMERLQTPFERQDGRCHRSAFVRVRPTEGDHRDDIFTCDLHLIPSSRCYFLVPRCTCLQPCHTNERHIPHHHSSRPIQVKGTPQPLIPSRARNQSPHRVYHLTCIDNLLRPWFQWTTARFNHIKKSTFSLRTDRRSTLSTDEQKRTKNSHRRTRHIGRFIPRTRPLLWDPKIPNY